MTPRQSNLNAAALFVTAVFAGMPDAFGTMRSRVIQNEDADFWERLRESEFGSHSIWTSNPSLPPNTGAIPNAMPSSGAPVVADVCEIALSVTCTGDDGVDCAFMPPKTKDCDVQLIYVYNVINAGMNALDVTFLQVSHGVDTYDFTDSFNPKTLAAGESVIMRQTKKVDFCSDGNYITVATIQAKHVEGSACEAVTEYEFDIMAECKIRLDIACNIIDGPNTGKDCRSLEASAGNAAGNGTSGCPVDVEYAYELTNIGIADLTITRFESLLNGDPQHLLRGPHLATVVLPPTGILVANRNETVDTCRDIQYISTGAVSAESTDGQECGDVADFAFEIVPSESA